MARGLFITFEGGEGVGKTTQIKRLGQTLQSQGHDTIITREPGGCPAAEEIRNLVSDERYGESWTPEAELMLFFAARAMHLKETVVPALGSNKTVLCDRYIDSTRVYQGHVQGMDMRFILNLEDRIVGDYVPDLTFIMDLPADMAIKRVESRGAQDHYDRGNIDFYEGLRQGFLNIAKDNPDRCVIIDASQDEEIIATAIYDVVQKKTV